MADGFSAGLWSIVSVIAFGMTLWSNTLFTGLGSVTTLFQSAFLLLTFFSAGQVAVAISRRDVEVHTVD